MANYSFTTTDERRFPNGTSVSLYAVSNWPTPEQQRNPTGSPPGSRTGSAQTVSGGSATFTSVPEGDYYAYASVGGNDVYKAVHVGSPLSGPHIPVGDISTDGTFASANDQQIPSVLAAKTYANGRFSSGTLAARPAAATFGVGIYFATDDNGGTLYQSDGSTWTAIVAAQQSLGYVERTAGDLTTTSTSAVDATGMTITFTTDGRPFEVWYAGMMKGSASGGEPCIQLVQGTSTVVDQKIAFAAANNQTFPFNGRRVFNLAAASYTYKLQMLSVITGTTTIYANSNNVLSLGANYR